jgi:hypothetical protein
MTCTFVAFKLQYVNCYSNPVLRLPVRCRVVVLVGQSNKSEVDQKEKRVSVKA